MRELGLRVSLARLSSMLGQNWCLANTLWEGCWNHFILKSLKSGTTICIVSALASPESERSLVPLEGQPVQRPWCRSICGVFKEEQGGLCGCYEWTKGGVRENEFRGEVGPDGPCGLFLHFGIYSEEDGGSWRIFSRLVTWSGFCLCWIWGLCWEEPVRTRVEARRLVRKESIVLLQEVLLGFGTRR